MRAMVLERNGAIETNPLKSQEVSDPWPQDHEIRIRVQACAICRTDLHVIEGELAKKKLPLIPGHQVVGTVEKVGRTAKRFKVGQRVGVAWLRSVCGTCQYCLIGSENLCESSKYNGYHADGGYADFICVPDDFAYEIPAGLDTKEAAPLLCAGIVGYRALKRAQLPKGGTLGIFGFGSSAHIVTQLAKHQKARVYVVTRGESHRALAQKLGADWVGTTAYDLPRKLDSAILFAPAGELVPQALISLRRGGTLALAGIYLSSIPALDYEKHLFYEKNIHSVTSSTRRDGVEFLREAAAIGIKPQITMYPLAEANRALQDLKADRINGSGVLVF